MAISAMMSAQPMRHAGGRGGPARVSQNDGAAATWRLHRTGFIAWAAKEKPSDARPGLPALSRVAEGPFNALRRRQPRVTRVDSLLAMAGWAILFLRAHPTAWTSSRVGLS